MEIRTLRYFLAVAREENMTRADEILHVTKPTLSKALRSLEDELGSLLKNRYWVIAIVFIFVCLFATAILGGMGMYYAKAVLGDTAYYARSRKRIPSSSHKMLPRTALHFFSNTGTDGFISQERPYAATYLCNLLSCVRSRLRRS